MRNRSCRQIVRIRVRKTLPCKSRYPYSCGILQLWQIPHETGILRPIVFVITREWNLPQVLMSDIQQELSADKTFAVRHPSPVDEVSTDPRSPHRLNQTARGSRTIPDP